MTYKHSNNLKYYRLKRKLTQQAVAEHIGHSSANRLSTWEGGTASPSVQNLMKLAELYGVSIDKLVTPRTRAKRVKKHTVKNPGLIGKYAKETMLQQKFILMSEDEKIAYLADMIVEAYFDSKKQKN